MKFVLIALLIFSPTWAHANVGLPVVAFGWPFLAANLLFVVAIETFVLRRGSSVRAWPILKHVLIANLLTTLVGYPLVAGLEALSPALGWNLGWILPFPNLEQKRIYVSTMMLLTLIPCYFLSVWLEGLWLKRWLTKDLRWSRVHLAHLASYFFLVIQVYGQWPIPLMKYATWTFEPTYVALMKVIYFFVQ